MDTNHAPAPGSLRVGWIGAGRMGAAMARRLAQAGDDVTVWNRTRSKAEALADSGCNVADAIADLRGHDVVFSAPTWRRGTGLTRRTGSPGGSSPHVSDGYTSVGLDAGGATHLVSSKRLQKVET